MAGWRHRLVRPRAGHRARGCGAAPAGPALGRHRTPPPRSWWKTVALGILAGALFLVLGGAIATGITSLLAGEAPDQSRFDILRGNPVALVAGLFSVWTSAAFGEEILTRGYLMDRIAALAGGGKGAWATAVLGSSVLFGLMHFYQGRPWPEARRTGPPVRRFARSHDADEPRVRGSRQ
jgi:membrane protease YdiL (CAAX protease family)